MDSPLQLLDNIIDRASKVVKDATAQKRQLLRRHDKPEVAAQSHSGCETEESVYIASLQVAASDAAQAEASFNATNFAWLEWMNCLSE